MGSYLRAIDKKLKLLSDATMVVGNMKDIETESAGLEVENNASTTEVSTTTTTTTITPTTTATEPGIVIFAILTRIFLLAFVWSFYIRLRSQEFYRQVIT